MREFAEEITDEQKIELEKKIKTFIETKLLDIYVQPYFTVNDDNNYIVNVHF